MPVFPLKIFKVADKSMEPALGHGDYILVSLWKGRVSKNDIVVVRHPTTGMSMVKRVREFNGKDIFVVGDNELYSEDSRDFGALDREHMMGKMIVKLS